MKSKLTLLALLTVTSLHAQVTDSTTDMPKMRQGALMSRWAYMSDAYIFQAAVKATMIWGPVHGTVWYLGFRLNWNKM